MKQILILESACPLLDGLKKLYGNRNRSVIKVKQEVVRLRIVLFSEDTFNM